MTKPEPATPAEETFAQVLRALKDEYGVSESEIARRLNAHVSTVNNWAHGKALPRQNALLGLAALFPKYKKRLFAAAGKRPPAPLSPDGREELLETFDRLTQEQQQMLLIQARAVADSNER
ncbi:helix-turn-helix domain-containing protein [Streptomyces olindensis]|uniref:helix-turn-helix domain-containing protein n=1 Tax=Streptomyces olindensis TaxID=358823 RepID=UPI00368B274C